MGFDPEGVGIRNGNIFGFPYSEEEAEVLIIPVTWDATASFGKGTAQGPEAILEASVQLDFFHPEVENAWERKIHMLPISRDLLEVNQHFLKQTEEYISYLEEGGLLENSPSFKIMLEEVEKAQKNIQVGLRNRVLDCFKKGKFPITLGGEHSVSLGAIEAAAEKFGEISIVQLDAHADLRNSYEGFEQSHASIMYNALKLSGVKEIHSLGIRDVSNSEVCLAKKDRVKTGYGWDISSKELKGKDWDSICDEMLEGISAPVYLTVDVDLLDPSYCPNTGTPVPGGWSFNQLKYFLSKLRNKGLNIVAADLVEVANAEWDANVGARILWELCHIKN
jgi:agmatinase